MALYMLDTNVVSALESSDAEDHDIIYERFRVCEMTDVVCVSVLTLFEYQYGVANTPAGSLKAKLRASVASFQNFFTPAPLTSVAALIFGDLRKGFEKMHGMRKKEGRNHIVDLMIAASAIDLNAILVSDDRIFHRLTSIDYRLKLENWRDL